MPPRSRITKELIADAAFEITRSTGIESVNARSIAQRLQCSTQPVMYWFATIEEIRQEVFRLADEFHAAYIFKDSQGKDAMMAIGVAYVHFAAEEKYLFRLLFQSDRYAKLNLKELIDGAPVKPILDILVRENHLSPAEAKELFTVRFMLVHGMASLMANNSMVYNEETVLRVLRNHP